MKFLVTGAAGFIGSALSLRLTEAGHEVVGIDNLNDYYDVNLKLARLERLKGKKGFRFEKMDIVDREPMEALFKREKFDKVGHLAAQAGVRYSTVNTHAYASTNIVGTLNILEGCRHQGVKHLVYASTSSVYGLNTKMPFSEHRDVDHPVFFTALRKRRTRQWPIPIAICTGCRRPDCVSSPSMGPGAGPIWRSFSSRRTSVRINRSMFSTTGSINVTSPTSMTSSRALPGLWKVRRPPGMKNGTRTAQIPPQVQHRTRSSTPGNHEPVELMRYIELIEENLGKTAQKNFLPLQ